MLPLGATAPDFTLPDENGDTTTLSDYRGKQPVVLVFYPGDSTMVCTAQLCELRDAYESIAATGAVLFGINPFSAESHRRFTQKHGFPFRLLVDDGHRVSRAYRTALGWGLLSMTNRSVYVISREGTVAWRRLGKPSSHEILAALRQAA